jgi:hypothetical protein
MKNSSVTYIISLLFAIIWIVLLVVGVGMDTSDANGEVDVKKSKNKTYIYIASFASMILTFATAFIGVKFDDMGD